MHASLEIREARPEDDPAIRRVHEEAFGRVDEADLVDALRAHGRVALSMVACEHQRVIGHLLLSTASIEDKNTETPCLALAPMGVLPSAQRRGVGTNLVQSALQWCRTHGHSIVVVLGHPEYYPRFGFRPAAPQGIECPYDAPDEAFLVLGLVPGALGRVAGRMRYAPEFPQ